MTPKQAFDSVVFTIGHVDRKLKPGEFIARASREVREALARLTSADASNVPNYVARLFVGKPGFCEHGFTFSERCQKCKRTW